ANEIRATPLSTIPFLLVREANKTMNRILAQISHSAAARGFALASAVALALVLAGCGSQAAEKAGGPPPADVNVAPVLQKNVRQWDEFTGRIAAVETVELRPRVSGYIDRVAYQ